MHKAVIIGAGPAGLTAAYTLAKAGYEPLVLEATDSIGGISRTVEYRGSRMDIGGHRFFTKSGEVMSFWREIMPFDEGSGASGDDVMLIRNRLSRILYLGKFFDYPVTLSLSTLKNLGFKRAVKIGFSYMRYALFPIKEEKSLEDFFTNRFGRELYNTFFRDYTEKVWGVPCSEIPADWGAQRVKGVSVAKVLSNGVKKIFKGKKDIGQKDVETSLISRFLYPKYGPGQLWEKCAGEIERLGGSVRKGAKVIGVNIKDGKAVSVSAINEALGVTEEIPGDHFISSMPVKDLIAAMGGAAPENVREAAAGLPYRDFIAVGLLLSDTLLKDRSGELRDNWIYVQEPYVKVGRLQLFRNWSPYMVGEGAKHFIGMEYFADEGDEMWNMPNDEMAAFAISEMEKLGIIKKDFVLGCKVVHMPKAYPAYFGTYKRFGEIREFTDTIDNLWLVGRNGMHRYNNSDHSSLTAMTAARNIMNGTFDKAAIWDVNTEREYHEEKGK